MQARAGSGGSESRGRRPGSRALGWVALAAALACGCSEANSVGWNFVFTRGSHGWSAGFADYPAGQEAFYGLQADYRSLPEPLDTSRSALFIAGVNRSDDLFMFYKGQGALQLDTSYRVTFEVEIATAVPSGCVGVGGAPGESVWVKAGVTTVEPLPFIDGSGYFRMNVDKGAQASGGENAVVLGDIANSQSCREEARWELKTLSSPESITVTTDGDGDVWVFVGTDSGFESLSALYYTRVAVDFEPI